MISRNSHWKLKMKLKTEIERELHGAKRTLKRKNVTFFRKFRETKETNIYSKSFLRFDSAQFGI